MEATEIWNRAAIHRGGTEPRPGDVALAALLVAHSLAMNGGVAHAVGCLNVEELRDACEGYAFFGLGEVGRLLMDAASAVGAGDMSEESELAMDAAYGRLVPDDGILVARFESHYAAHRDLYAPTKS